MSSAPTVAERRQRLLEAFKVFDPDNTGHVDTKAMCIILSSLGNKLSRNEINELTADADRGGMIVYQSYIEGVLLPPDHK